MWSKYFFKRIGSNSISISAGMFKNPTKLKTEINIYTKGKLDYYKLDKKLPKFQKLPKFYRYSDWQQIDKYVLFPLIDKNEFAIIFN